MFASGESSITKQDILDVIPDTTIAAYYLGITKIPCLVNSPLRNDKNPSVGFYYKNGKILWTDFSDKSGGDVFQFLEKLWHKPLSAVLSRIKNDMPSFNSNAQVRLSMHTTPKLKETTTTIQCKIRPWKQHDIDYWKSYGISKDWLEFADIYPVQRVFITKDDKTLQFTSDKYAYAYVEHKEGKTSLKIYQPFNTKGYKWTNNHDKSVISLWTKLPENGEAVCVCSSMKDALCLWANTGIPSIAVQGEGYTISNTALKQLKDRFKHCFVLFDNDEPGLTDGIKFSQATGFINIVLPKFPEGKDISDLFKSIKDQNRFKQLILKLLSHELRKNL